MSELAVLEFESQPAWEDWLDKNYGQPDGVWLKFAKKNSGETTVSYSQAVDAALCYGWIDSQVKRFDQKFYIQKFSPRRAKSVWSKINREHVERLLAEGKMKPAGLAQVQAAKADGRWESAYAGQATAEVPEDFKQALSKNKKAAEFFDTLNKTNKYTFIWRLHHIKKSEARAVKIEEFVQMLAKGQKFH